MTSFIGFGTGRCGTHSLAKILESCSGVRVSHEKFLVKWGDENRQTEEEIINYLLNPRYNLNGVVSLTHIHLIRNLDKRIKNLKLVHIWREKEDVAKSFCRMHTGISRVLPEDYAKAIANSNTHISKNRKLNKLAGHPDIYPKIQANDCIDSYEKYWEMYMRMVFELEMEYDIYDIHVSSLNDDLKLSNLYDYLEIDPSNRRYPKNRKYD